MKFNNAAGFKNKPMTKADNSSRYDPGAQHGNRMLTDSAKKFMKQATKDISQLDEFINEYQRTTPKNR